VSPRTGRRPGVSDTRERILSAARTTFAARGYDPTSLREVAREAGVDPALVVRFFGSKAQLFTTAMRLPLDTQSIVQMIAATPRREVGERIARYFLGLWDEPVTREPMLAMIRSAVTHDQAAGILRGFLNEALIGPVAGVLGTPDPELRTTLVGSQLVGMAMVRYVLEIEPLASTDTETVVRWIAPTLQRYLTRGSVESR